MEIQEARIAYEVAKSVIIWDDFEEAVKVRINSAEILKQTHNIYAQLCSQMTTKEPYDVKIQIRTKRLTTRPYHIDVEVPTTVADVVHYDINDLYPTLTRNASTAGYLTYKSGNFSKIYESLFHIRKYAKMVNDDVTSHRIKTLLNASYLYVNSIYTVIAYIDGKQVNQPTIEIFNKWFSYLTKENGCFLLDTDEVIVKQGSVAQELLEKILDENSLTADKRKFSGYIIRKKRQRMLDRRKSSQNK